MQAYEGVRAGSWVYHGDGFQYHCDNPKAPEATRVYRCVLRRNKLHHCRGEARVGDQGIVIRKAHNHDINDSYPGIAATRGEIKSEIRHQRDRPVPEVMTEFLRSYPPAKAAVVSKSALYRTRARARANPYPEHQWRRKPQGTAAEDPFVHRDRSVAEKQQVIVSRRLPGQQMLLGNFEKSLLHSRFQASSSFDEAVTARIRTRGRSYPMRNTTLPVVISYSNSGDDYASSMTYLAHINLGKKGYQVPCKGTIRVTIFKSAGVFIKTFVVSYDFSDMPPQSFTFLLQKTLEGQTLRYMIHLRFMSDESRRTYLLTDIPMLIYRGSNNGPASVSRVRRQMRNFTEGPTNPKYSPRL